MNTPVDPARIYAQAVNALNQSNWREAQRLAQDLLAHVPNHGGVHFVLGLAALQQRNMPLAIQHLQQAVRLSPQRPDYVSQWARALATIHRLREAVMEADRALALNPTDPLTLDTLGVVYTQANEHKRAAEVFQRAVSMVPNQASFRFNLATSLTFTGDLCGAENEYEVCVQMDPTYWKAHLALSQLRKQTETGNHVERLQTSLESAGMNPEALLYLNLALEKEYDDLGNYTAAFDHLKRGKAAWRRRLGYSFARDEALFEAITGMFPVGRPQADGWQTSEPIFVMGMPRTGTTLVDRIISSHPRVHSAGELQNFAVALKRASGSVTPPMLDVDTIKRSGGLSYGKLGEAYLASTRPGTGSVPHFIDKLPHNFMYAGFIAQALPEAKLICLRRNPMDTCVSNFRQLFALSSPYYDYSFDLLDTGHYYLLFDKLMRHWNEVMPGRILEVEYESLVEDQEGVTRRILEHCGLPWDDACLRFEENAAPVATASAVQVRSPIYRSSLQRWKRYGEQLDDLRRVLEDGGVALS